MDAVKFATIFLPDLIKDYVKGTLPFYGLVDFDTWKKDFPENAPTQIDPIQWSNVQLSCKLLTDRTILISFILPQSQKNNEMKFVAIQLNPEEHTVRRAVFYVMSKSQDSDGSWDLYHLPIPEGENKFELRFRQKIIGSEDLCNFETFVQQIDFNDNWND